MIAKRPNGAPTLLGRSRASLSGDTAVPVDGAPDPTSLRRARFPAGCHARKRRLVRALGARSDLLFVVAVALGYVGLTIAFVMLVHGADDRMMVLAERITEGRLDDPSFAGTVDSVTVSGRSYVAVGPLQLVPYLLFVPFPALHHVASFVIGVTVGAAAALAALPLVRAYGATGQNAMLIAACTAFGTLLLFVSVAGDFYYLAQAESFLLLELFLLEWAGRRRPPRLGIALGLSFLARPTTLLAAIPFGLVLVWRSRSRIAAASGIALPIGLALIAYGLFNVARYGSLLESGYGIATVWTARLSALRARGLFSYLHIPENLRLAVLALPQNTGGFPFIAPNPNGMSMLLVSPALLIALRAKVRPGDGIVLWAAIALIAVPVFTFYGGGAVQYGYRYSLDFTPFLIALMAMGARGGIGWGGRGLIAFSIFSVVLGCLWRAQVFQAP
jgi:hypothetical protein